MGSCNKTWNRTRMLTLSQNQNKLKLALILAGSFILILLVLIIFSSIKKTKPKQALPQPSISAQTLIPPKAEIEKQPQSIKDIKQKIIASPIENNGGDLILYKTDSFRISYVPILEIFFVDILRDPAQTAKKQAQDWFLNFGLKQEELCDFPVRFSLFNINLKKTNPNFSLLPDGCQ